ncbi:hypothetical protein BS50DRAFT_573614 [Corynespora cassiicola Philippines]|uniref:Uncharacterized protein n=1 Tax=Corynespora cassiicola Philippines TaxID=1448308 RepID=A0A2T2NN12_CORCC|nr:hypothetical protein BS50DRAFT_573614 [Corynespora cassiicola Philippines]
MAPTTTKSATKAKPAAATAGVAKKRGPGAKRANAKNAMIKMQAYFQENRPKYKHLTFKEQQKELGKQWKASPENPKNNA